MLSRKNLLKDLIGKPIDIQKMPDSANFKITNSQDPLEYSILDVGEDIIKVQNNNDLTSYQYYAIDQIFLLILK